MRLGELACVLLISIVLVVLGAAVASATGAEANKFSGNQRFEAGPGLSLEESIKEAYKRITPAGGWPAFAEFVTCTGKPGGMQGMHNLPWLAPCAAWTTPIIPVTGVLSGLVPNL